MAPSKTTIAAVSGIIILGAYLIDRSPIPAAVASIFGKKKRGPRSKLHQRSFTSQEQEAKRR